MNLLTGNIFQLRNRIACGFGDLVQYIPSGRVYKLKGDAVLCVSIKRNDLHTKCIPDRGWRLLDGPYKG